MQPLSASNRPINLTAVSQDIHTSLAGKVDEVTLVVSNVDGATHILTIDIGASTNVMEQELRANTTIELPAILVTDGDALSALADVGDVLRVVGRVSRVG